MRITTVNAIRGRMLVGRLGSEEERRGAVGGGSKQLSLHGHLKLRVTLGVEGGLERLRPLHRLF